MCPLRPDDRSLRLFVAVDLPEQVRGGLGRLQEELRRRDLSDLRWASPRGIHLTLKFLGETPAGKVSAITEALASAIRGRPGFHLALGEPGTFGGRRGPRVLWLDVVGDIEPLRGLQTAVEEALADVGFPPDERGFSPHLTLARVRQPAPAGTGERVARALEAVTPPQAEFDVREVVLMRSTLQPGGAVYERLAVFPLA
jgi:2'-5' RNA ligase